MSTFLSIPTFNSTDDYTQSTTLDGKDYVFRFQYNTRSGFWFMSLYDNDESPIVEGRKVVVNRDLLHGVTDARRPVGALVCLEVHDGVDEPTRDSFGVDHVLHYYVP